MRTLLVLASLLAAALIAVAIAIESASVDPAVAGQLANVRELVWRLGANAWEFARPLLQLVIVLLILEWLFRRVGVTLRTDQLWTNWTIQTFIAAMIISTFCIAVLADIKAVGYLKDVVLIVIGFYFGTRARPETRAARDEVPPAGGGPRAPSSSEELSAASSAPSRRSESYEERNPVA